MQFKSRHEAQNAPWAHGLQFRGTTALADPIFRLRARAVHIFTNVDAAISGGWLWIGQPARLSRSLGHWPILFTTGACTDNSRCCPNQDARPDKLAHCAWNLFRAGGLYLPALGYSNAGGRPRWAHPPVTCRVSEIRAASAQPPRAGAVSLTLVAENFHPSFRGPLNQTWPLVDYLGHKGFNTDGARLQVLAEIGHSQMRNRPLVKRLTFLTKGIRYVALPSSSGPPEHPRGQAASACLGVAGPFPFLPCNNMDNFREKLARVFKKSPAQLSLFDFDFSK